MKIQPRQQLLELWQAVARSSYRNYDHLWTWGDRHERNSVSDATQLLCLLSPASNVPAFQLDSPDRTAEDVLDALRPIGDSVEIPRTLVRVITEYLQTYTGEDGTPIFTAGAMLCSVSGDEEPTKVQRACDVVESFATSLTLSLATVAFARLFRVIITREVLRQEVDRLESMASKRLSAAMVGLLRSFTVSVFEVDSPMGQALCRTANQSGLPHRQVVADLHSELREVTAALRDLVLGSGQVATDVDNPNRLFECGWSWGVAEDAPEVATSEDVGRQSTGVAVAAPYLYFTKVALDAIQDLFSERTRILGLLNEEQQRLANALQLRWDLTHSYWSTIATIGRGRWPLEDIPWRTSDGVESDYFSLLVASMVISNLPRRRATDADTARITAVLNDLANVGRVTRRPSSQDPALALHTTGVTVVLEGAERLGPALSWVTTDFSPLLLRSTLRLAGIARDADSRQRLLQLADLIWDHLRQRRFTGGAARDLWDEPGPVFGLDPLYVAPTWPYTARVVDCLVAGADLASSPPLRSEALAEAAMDLLSEADHLYDQELLAASAEAGPAIRTTLATMRAMLVRARAIAEERPGTASVLAQEVLRELDRLAAARSEVLRGS